MKWRDAEPWVFAILFLIACVVVVMNVVRSL